MGDKDKLYKELFSNPTMIRDLLIGFLQDDAVKKLDFDSLTRCNASYVTHDLREKFDDMVWKLKCGENWFYLYILIEFQSTVDKYMAVRLMSYIGLLYEDILKGMNNSDQSKKSEKVKKPKELELLPPVLPLVIYDGNAKWTAPIQLSDLIINPSIKLSDSLSKYIPSLQYLLVDIGNLRQEVIDNELPVSISAFFDITRSSDVKSLEKTFSKYYQWFDAPEQENLKNIIRMWFQRIMESLAKKSGESIPELANLQEVDSMLSDIANWPDKWIAKGREEGIEKGIEKGIKKGREEGIEKGIKKGREEGIEKGKKEGREEERKKHGAKISSIALKMLAKGTSIDEIIEITGLSKEQILDLKQQS